MILGPSNLHGFSKQYDDENKENLPDKQTKHHNSKQINDDKDYADNKLEKNTSFPDDTVIHNLDADVSLPDYMKFKPSTSSFSGTGKESSVPSLSKTVSTLPTFNINMKPLPLQHNGVDDDSFDTSSFEVSGFDIDNFHNRDLTKILNEPRLEYDAENQTDPSVCSNSVTFDIDAADIQSQQKPSNMASSQEHQNRKFTFFNSNTMGTEKESLNYKTTSFTSSHQAKNSPLPVPKLKRTAGVKGGEYTDLTNSRIPDDSQDEHYHSSLRPINLITPVAEGMNYKPTSKKWVYTDEHLNPHFNDSDLNLEKSLNISSPPLTRSTLTIPDTTAAALENITTLMNVDLSFSRIKEGLVDLLQGMISPKTNWKTITEIDLSSQHLESVEGLSTLLPSLLTVHLEKNSLTFLKGLGASVMRLDVSGNLLHDRSVVFDETFHNLEVLDISQNRLRSLRRFEPLRNLKKLFLSSNDISSLVSLSSVEYLDLSDNDIRGELDFLQYSFPRLETLILSDNKIKKISNMNLPNLKVLDLNRNLRLTSIDNSKLSNLLQINLLDCIHMTRLNCDNFPKLQSLILEGSVNIKGNMKYLNHLYIQNAVEWFAGRNTVKINKHLEYITMKECGLTSFEEIRNIYKLFPHLKVLNLQDNNIDGTYTELLEVLKAFKKLEIVHIDGNTIKDRFLNDKKRMELFNALIYKIINGD